ncbi:MAG: YbaN family protein [Maricaulis sp.]|nr:YbaN family protein [Maricaulis sp.]MDG2044669.1 YbaN family protein [Maricaulis sp.]
MFKRIIWLTFGMLALGLAILGAILPLLPTTPFLLLATYAFARSSKRLHTWLTEHRIFGGLIRNWQKNGSIDRKTKLISVSTMVGLLALSWALDVRPLVLIIQAVVLTCSAIFVLTRPDAELDQP